MDFIVIPAGTISKFEVLLSDYKDKLIEYEEEKGVFGKTYDNLAGNNNVFS